MHVGTSLKSIRLASYFLHKVPYSIILEKSLPLVGVSKDENKRVLRLANVLDEATD